MSSESMPAGWQENAVQIASVALATSVAALAMQVFSMADRVPDNDGSLRAALVNVAPEVSDVVIDAALGLVVHALLQVEQLRAKGMHRQ
ncbi:hypothetical protein ABE438_17670 [Bosea sp. TWI1241]|uniref:hypothetical protein n=1 Tax=Bosea sp. TWI1241 TaxID=3148904 RepID=UPI00320AA26F